MFVRDDCPADCAGQLSRERSRPGFLSLTLSRPPSAAKRWTTCSGPARRAAAREASAFRTSMIALVIVRDCAGYCADCAGAYSLHLAICADFAEDCAEDCAVVLCGLCGALWVLRFQGK